MPSKISFTDIPSSSRENDEPTGATVRSPMERLAARFDLSAFDLWIVILTIIALALIYGIGEIAAKLSG